MRQMTFQEENGYIVCYIDGKEVSRAKKSSAGASTQDVIDIINDQIKANPDLSGTEDRLNGLQVGDDKYKNPTYSTVIVNPTLAGTEPELTGLDVDGVKYKNTQGTVVVANPTLAGTEANLEGAEIDGVKYKVGGGATLDDIVDSYGNKRFIEGDGTPATISGVTSSYCKWTLSGTHLMLVYVGMVEKNTYLSYNYLADFTLPTFILDKIVGTDVIESKFVTFYFSNNTLNFKVNLIKDTDKLRVKLDSSASINTYNYKFRIQFDLIIAVS